ncbi:hypothetical protein A3733_18315 [Pseudoalteromonas shioyasakiensis]|nr:hypothetical protein A3733_18315 [Pseudoalteromonas shioyasakiensis]
MAMTDAERQRKRREKLKNEAMKPLLVRGENGKFDERIRIALAIKKLSDEKKLAKETIELIVSTSASVFEGDDIVTQKYIKKLVSEYLETTDER